MMLRAPRTAIFIKNPAEAFGADAIDPISQQPFAETPHPVVVHGDSSHFFNVSDAFFRRVRKHPLTRREIRVGDVEPILWDGTKRDDYLETLRLLARHGWRDTQTVARDMLQLNVDAPPSLVRAPDYYNAAIDVLKHTPAASPPPDSDDEAMVVEDDNAVQRVEMERHLRGTLWTGITNYMRAHVRDEVRWQFEVNLIRQLYLDNTRDWTRLAQRLELVRNQMISKVDVLSVSQAEMLGALFFVLRAFRVDAPRREEAKAFMDTLLIPATVSGEPPRWFLLPHFYIPNLVDEVLMPQLGDDDIAFFSEWRTADAVLARFHAAMRRTLRCYPDLEDNQWRDLLTSYFVQNEANQWTWDDSNRIDQISPDDASDPYNLDLFLQLETELIGNQDLFINDMGQSILTYVMRHVEVI